MDKNKNDKSQKHLSVLSIVLICLIVVIALFGILQLSINLRNIIGKATIVLPAGAEDACEGIDAGQVYPCKGDFACCGGECVVLPNCLAEDKGTEFRCGRLRKFVCLERELVGVNLKEEIPNPPSNTCQDSDGGKNYYLKGIVTYSKGDTFVSEEDVCEQVICVTTPCPPKLHEFYCQNNEIKEEVVDCTSGCENGSCLNCTDECTSGSRVCSSNTTYQICGNYDSDNCTEWGSSTSCSSGGVCENGSCLNCTDECTYGSRRCSSNTTYQICGNYDSDTCTEWSSSTSCSSGEVCENGSCVGGEGCTTADCDEAALQQFITDNNIANSDVKTVCSSGCDYSDIESVPGCKLGVEKDSSGRIIKVKYNGYNCNIKVSKFSRIFELKNLQYLDLIFNQLTGSIPAELGNLGKLEDLNLSNNQLTGSIPAELGNLGKLETLYLSNNRLTGSIPAELGKLVKLETLILDNNQLTGSIPAELGNLGNLSYLSLFNNRLTGSIPAELGNLGKLSYLNLFNNQLTGSIPAELGNLGNLETLYLNNNRLTGSIPAELGKLGNLESLDLTYNYLILTGLENLFTQNLCKDKSSWGNYPCNVLPQRCDNTNDDNVCPTGCTPISSDPDCR